MILCVRMVLQAELFDESSTGFTVSGFGVYLKGQGT